LECKLSVSSKYKKPYKVTNWSLYERSLRERLPLTLWIGPDSPGAMLAADDPVA